MKNVVITILAMLVLGLGGYLVYDKVIGKEEETPIEEGNKEESVENKTETEKYELVDNAFSGIATFKVDNSMEERVAVQKVIIPRIKKETVVTKQINDKIYNSYLDDINQIKQITEGQKPNSFVDIKYDYTIKDNILFIQIISSYGVIDGGGSIHYAVYYYDVENDKELSVEEISTIFNISTANVKDETIEKIYAIMPVGVYSNGLEVFYTQDSTCPNIGCVSSEIIY